jgi:hypothetical protein
VGGLYVWGTTHTRHARTTRGSAYTRPSACRRVPTPARRRCLPATTSGSRWGVFGLVQGEKTAQHIFQLAVNQTGVVRGNYYDAVADNTLPVYGSVDRKTQRVAWSIGDKKTIVFETGLNNLTQQQTTLLAHYGKERTEEMALVRLEQPAQGQQ